MNNKKEHQYPAQEVDPENFLTNEEVLDLLESKDDYKFTQDYFNKLYNCVHCRECGTSDERIQLKQKFLKDGNSIEGLSEIIEIFERYGTPYPNNKSRVKIPDSIPSYSETLLYLGCFTSVKTPKYGENAINYLLKKGVNFCILPEEICCGYPILVTGAIESYQKLVRRNRELFLKKKFKRIITICPSCYMVFKKHYKDLGINIEYYTDYLEPSKEKKSGKVSIQHACPLVYDKKKGVDKFVEEILQKSGYTIMDIPMWCCGGGVGHQLRKEIAEAIAIKRVHEFVGDYITYYCPDCYWFINVFGKREKIKPKLKDLFELLT